ncbi:MULTISPECIES: hypothetical protein [Myxococcus]|uniref:Lipoprotein n=1 Tax=Myxococcus llanfairpwllgwyngyllgogerychwyrndrobwllllantysiliogogogochensis TaxID=2590453 RepID=A0A540WVX8_9BACT|nr:MULTISPECIES: hypothetical protein [Myxococcus]NTX06255.1 hypothetical protein [Myxococcus sp. CA040A]NTX09514.1 hypothetical protein [Myxococcus sp. CA056]NTX56851.1 hypothetical protein [Myxococcus sp. CA039A]TQF13159.1 hypothetical protein FJV41_25440 [Myxococcus llanfairpwllgwyngyllgogerychwyrndrobwllllantysiliogogogochensis]
MTKNTFKKSVAALALLGALPAVAGPATYAGALCTSVSGFAAPSIFRSGRLINQTGGAIEVVCPVQRNVVAPSFNENVSFLITARDPHLTENVCCTATLTEPDGTAITADSGCTAGADTANPKTISLNLATAFASVNGYIALRCELPGPYSGFQSTLSSFYISE